MAMVADRGAESMMLEVRADNSVAITLYERMGFERISTRTRYYADGTDAQIWRRRPIARDREVLA
jgi:ribosomal-protein-alanine N-acetyltransferase